MTSVLADADVERFITESLIKLPDAVPREVADAGRHLLWQEMGLSPKHPEEWTEAKIWLTGSSAEPFVAAPTQSG